MSNLEDDKQAEHSLDWLRALESDAAHVGIVLERVETLGIQAIEFIRHGKANDAIRKLAEMGEGIQLVKNLIGVGRSS